MASGTETRFNLTPFSSLFKCVYKWHQQKDTEEEMFIWPRYLYLNQEKLHCHLIADIFLATVGRGNTKSLNEKN